MKPLFNGPCCVKDETQGAHQTQQNLGCGIAKSIAVARAPRFPGSTFVRCPAITAPVASTDLGSTSGIKLFLNVSGATGHHAHRADHFYLADRPAFRVNDGRECLGTIVPVALNALGPVEQPYVVLDWRDQRVRGSGGYRKARRAASGRGCAR